MNHMTSVSPDLVFLPNKNASRITAWLGALLSGQSDSFGSWRLALSHIGPDGHRLLREFPVDGEPEAAQANEIVRSIEQTAMDDASHLGGPRQRYLLAATTDHGSELGSVILPYIPLAANGWPEADGSEPTERGVLQQTIRHNESILQMFLQTVAPMVDSMGRRITQQDGFIERAMERQSRFAEEKEELATKRQERDLALEAARRQQDIDNLGEIAANQKSEALRKFFGDKLDMVIPIALNRLAGHTVVPVTRTPADDLLATFAGHLTDADLARLRSVIGPELGGVLHELVTHVRNVGHVPTPTPATATTVPTPHPAATSGAIAHPTGTTNPEAQHLDPQDPMGPIPPTMIASTLEILRRDLLPWAAANATTGKDPIAEKPISVLLLSRLMSSLTAGAYERLFTSNPRLTPDERKVMAALLAQLELGPGRVETTTG
jgi:hypothetical protein